MNGWPQDLHTEAPGSTGAPQRGQNDSFIMIFSFIRVCLKFMPGIDRTNRNAVTIKSDGKRIANA